MDKVKRDGKVAVLVSYGYGAGWSTWIHGEADKRRALYCPALVEAILRKAPPEEVQAIAEAEFPDAYIGGVDDLTVEWIEEGVVFRVNEYDGAESIEYLSARDWEKA